MVFLRERLSRLQGVSLLLAATGVAVLAVRLGRVPWISLGLAVTFAVYGLLRKTVRAEAEVGLWIETTALAPLGVVYLAMLAADGRGALGHGGIGTDLMLLTAGVITALPLAWFTRGARRLTLATVGFLQYLAPSLQFLLGVAVYREPFTPAHLIAFSFIWTALVLFTVDGRRRWAAARRS